MPALRKSCEKADRNNLPRFAILYPVAKIVQKSRKKVGRINSAGFAIMAPKSSGIERELQAEPRGAELSGRGSAPVRAG